MSAPKVVILLPNAVAKLIVMFHGCTTLPVLDPIHAIMRRCYRPRCASRSLARSLESFLNVLVLRHGVKTLSGRSACASCGHELEPVDLVPIISYLALRGRCRFCGIKISIQYPLVELATALFFGCIGAAPIALPLQLLALPIAALLVAISAYDIRHGIIPDLWVFELAGLSLIFSLAYLTLYNGLSTFTPLFLAGPASALPFWALWFVSGGRAMGLGDAKLAWGIGWLLGPVYGFFSFGLAFVAGALISVCILLPLSSPQFWKFVRGFTPKSVSQEALVGVYNEERSRIRPVPRGRMCHHMADDSFRARSTRVSQRSHILSEQRTAEQRTERMRYAYSLFAIRCWRLREAQASPSSSCWSSARSSSSCRRSSSSTTTNSAAW